MNKPSLLNQTRRVGTGLAFSLFPLLFAFAFAVHPGLLNPHLLGPAELIARAHHNGLLQFGHVLVTVNCALLVVCAVHFMRRLEPSTAAWLGFVGAALAVLGAIFLAADKGALCLSLSALDTLPEKEFAQMLPGLLAMFSKQGWLALLWAILCLPAGFALQAVALLWTRTLPRWQSLLFLTGVLLVGTPDGVEIVNLTASILMAIAFVPYGLGLMRPEAQAA